MAIEPAKMGWLDRIVNVNWGARDLLVVQAQYTDILFGTGDFRTIATARGVGFMLEAVQVLLGGNLLDPTGQFGDPFYRLGTHIFSAFGGSLINGVLVFDVKALQASIGSSFLINMDFNAPGMTGTDQIDGNVFAQFHSKVQSISFAPGQIDPVIKYANGGGPGAAATGTARGLFSPPLDHFSVAVSANLATLAAPILTFTPP